MPLAEPGVEPGHCWVLVCCPRHTEEPAWVLLYSSAHQVNLLFIPPFLQVILQQAFLFPLYLSSSWAVLLCFSQQFPQWSGMESNYFLLFSFRLWSSSYPPPLLFWSQFLKKPLGRHVKLARENQILFIFILSQLLEVTKILCAASVNRALHTDREWRHGAHGGGVLKDTNNNYPSHVTGCAWLDKEAQSRELFCYRIIIFWMLCLGCFLWSQQNAVSLAFMNVVERQVVTPVWTGLSGSEVKQPQCLSAFWK